MFGRRHRTAVVLLLAAALALPGVAKAQYLVSTSGSLTMASDPGDWVGSGSSYSLSTPGDTFFAHSDGTTVDLRVGSWMLRFAAPAGEPLVPGTYTSALRAAFPRSGTPGLDVS